MTRLYYYLDPLSLRKNKKNVRVGRPQAKLFGSAHRSYGNNSKALEREFKLTMEIKTSVLKSLNIPCILNIFYPKSPLMNIRTMYYFILSSEINAYHY